MNLERNFAYDPEMDGAVSVGGTIKIHGRTYRLSAATAAGRRLPEDSLKPNEDALSIACDEHGITVAVFDGASSQQPIPELKEVTGARFASHTLKKLFEELAERQDMAFALQMLNQLLGDELREFDSVDLSDLNSLPTSTSTLARVNAAEGRLDIAHVGDTFASVLYTDGTTSLQTNNLHRPYDEEVLALIYDIAIETGSTPREAVRDARVRQAIMRMFQDTRNRADGRGEGMVNGDPNMNQYIHAASLSLQGVRAVLLGSDGLVPPGMDERREKDRRKMFAIARRLGVMGLIAETRRIEDEDPDRWMLRYKHSDDATGILIELLSSR